MEVGANSIRKKEKNKRLFCFLIFVLFSVIFEPLIACAIVTNVLVVINVKTKRKFPKIRQFIHLAVLDFNL